MSETLYRKYRPKSFDEILGQDHIVTTLSNAIKANRIAHAYLFTGSRGTGKTSTARLLAHAVNTMERDGFTPPDAALSEKFLQGQALDLIEIDAASHTGVENIRELRDTIALAPAEAAYKVYIIDEVHMLSTGAFNALLKTLEEPPEHAIFILATTEIQKVPETILSRCQCFDFTRVSLADLSKKITMIAKAEGVTMDPEAIEMIGISARGGMRDAESLLGQVFALEDKKVTVAEVSLILGTTTNEDVYALLKGFVTRDLVTSIDIIGAVVEKGFNLDTFVKTALIKSRALLFAVVKDSVTTEELGVIAQEKKNIDELVALTSVDAVLTIIEELQKAKNGLSGSVIAQLPLEIAAVRICGSKPSEGGDKVAEKVSSQATTAKEASTVKKSVQAPATIQSSVSGSGALSIDDIRQQWATYVNHVQIDNPSLGMILANTVPYRVIGDTLTLAVQYTLHKERILEVEVQQLLTATCEKIYQTVMALQVEVVDEDTLHAAAPSELLSRASASMGGQMI